MLLYFPFLLIYVILFHIKMYLQRSRNLSMITRFDTPRLTLRLLSARHHHQILRFLQYNQAIFDASEPEKPDNFYTEEFQRHLAASEYHSSKHNTFIRYYIFLKKKPKEIIGCVSFGQLQSAPFYSCTIGYKLDSRYGNMGYATEAVRAAIEQLCATLPMHRITAYILPDNQPSIHLATKLGFQYEGTSMRLVNIGGNWRDHLKYVYINHAAESI
jgi:ribosomal-protein-alanine N-acetyltransferase